MLSLRRQAPPLVKKALSSSPSPLYCRAFSSKPPPPTFTAPPPKPKGPPAATPPPTPTPPPPKTAPPTGGAAAPPPAAAGGGGGGGLGLGTAISMVTLAGATAVTGYYYVLADEKEKAAIEGYVAEAKAFVGLAPAPSPTAEAAATEVKKEAENTLSKPREKVEKVIHDVKEGTVHATQNVKAQLRKAVTTAEHVVHAVEEKVAGALHGTPAAENKDEDTPAAAAAAAAAGETAAAAAATVVEKAKEAATQAKEAATHVVENAEHLAEQIMADIQERTAAVGGGGGDGSGATTQEKEKESTLGKLQTEAALKHFSAFESRGKELRFETLTRAAEEALAQGEALRQHLEKTLLKDLASLNPEQLQHRVVQLAGELQERTKWEALRLHEAVRKAEVEVSGKYTELIEKLKEESTEELSRQARAFTAEKEMALQRLAEDKEREFKAFFEAEMTNFKQKVTAAFEEQRAKDKAEVEAHAKRTAENIIYENQTKYQETVAGRVEELEKLQAQVMALEEVFKTDTDYEHLSWNVHKITAALLAFELSLLTSSPIQKELDALAKVTKGDHVIDSVLSSLPPAVGDGVPTLSELQVRFPTVQTAAREAAFVPETSPGMMGHMFGSVLATITIKPRGLVEGKGADEVLARAAYYVERGDLADAVTELEGLGGGLVGKAVESWLGDAKGRLVVQQAVRVMNARSALLNGSLV